MTVETINWHTLHPRYLNEQSKVLDLGANYGFFARAVTERFGCTCLAIEPSPQPFDSIQTTPRISKMHCGAAGTRGTRKFKVAENELASAFCEEGVFEVEVFPLAELVDRCGGVDLLKIDIEGSEIELLEACPDEVLCTIGQISVEFHDFCGITSATEVERVKSRLHNIGFESVRMSGVGHQDTWFINRTLLPISSLEMSYIRHVVRNVTGFKRVAARKLLPIVNRSLNRLN